jgi:catechol 2,3-dioxygenase-like lactoylglutathione lyase family enzyme
MALHRLTSITLGVPDVAATAAYYEEFGLVRGEDGSFSTVDGGQQLKLEYAERRSLLHLGVGVDDPDDIARIAVSLANIEARVSVRSDGTSLASREPVAGFTVDVSVAPHYDQAPAEKGSYNLPGRNDRPNRRAPGILRDGPVRPRKLGHVVIGTTDREATERFFAAGLGFKISDTVKNFASFMRCSPDHHNVFVQSAPINFLHHTAWQVEDIDEVGRGAMAMLEGRPERHGWGLGRHFLGSNFFWYLKDPAGNFSEYYSDMDTILDDQLWTPEDWEGAKALYSWGPEPTKSFLNPEDLAARMMGAHSAG